jgi:hypothetical protein
MADGRGCDGRSVRRSAASSTTSSAMSVGTGSGDYVSSLLDSLSSESAFCQVGTFPTAASFDRPGG